jgi:inhibitor of cysteine peptidase
MSSNQVVGNRGLWDIDTEFEEFTVEPRGTPMQSLHRVFNRQRYIEKAMADVFVSKSHHGGSVALRTGDVLVVELPEIFSTGFRWAFSADPQGALTTAGDEFTPNSGGGVGSGGVRVWRFIARRPGTDSIQLKLWREWEGEQSVSERFMMAVTVNWLKSLRIFLARSRRDGVKNETSRRTLIAAVLRLSPLPDAHVAFWICAILI